MLQEIELTKEHHQCLLLSCLWFLMEHGVSELSMQKQNWWSGILDLEGNYQT